MKDNNPIKIIEYGTSLERQRDIGRRTIWEFINFSNAVALFCVAVDFTCSFITWNTVQNENWYMVALISVAIAIILDVPMMYAGSVYKAYRQGLKSRRDMKLTLATSIVAFLLAYIPSFVFRLATRDATFEPASATMTASNLAGYAANIAGSEENVSSVLIAAICIGLLPLGTSITSFVVGFCSSDPLAVRLNKINKSRSLAEQQLAHLNQILAEEESITERRTLMIAHEKDLAIQFIQECYAQEAIRIQAFLEALEEKCDADGITRIVDYAQQVLEKHKFHNELPEETYNALVSCNGKPNAAAWPNQAAEEY